MSVLQMMLQKGVFLMALRKQIAYFLPKLVLVQVLIHKSSLFLLVLDEENHVLEYSFDLHNDSFVWIIIRWFSVLL